MIRMVYFYIDTSVLVKRYKTEEGTELADLLMDEMISEGNVVATSSITMVELFSVLKRAQKGRILSKKDVSIALAAIARDSERIMIRSVSEDTMGKALEVIMEHGTRALDAIHLGSLLELRETMRLIGEDVYLISDDQEMCKAARCERFDVITSKDIGMLRKSSKR